MIKSLSFFCLIFLSVSVFCQDHKRPNIIFILVDDQRWVDFGESIIPGCPEASSDYLETPHLNKFAKTSLVFTDAYATAPICTPTRSSLLYGMTPARQKGTEFIGFFDPKGYKAIPEYLKEVDANYQCAVFRKWGETMDGYSNNMKKVNKFIHPEALAFDESDGRFTGNKTGGLYPNPYWKKNKLTPEEYTLEKKQFDQNYYVEPDEDPKRTNSLTERSLDFLKKQVEQKTPFYLQINYYAIHTGYSASPETIGKYADKPNPKRRLLRGVGPVLDELDQAIGWVLDSVEAMGLSENTYIFISSDNGGEGIHQPPWSNKSMPNRNTPLRHIKGSLYEGGVRVPFMVQDPGVNTGFVSEPVILVDLLPTFYELAGGKKKLPPDVDGKSLTPLFQGITEKAFVRENNVLIFHRPFWRVQSHSAIREGDYKLVITWEKTGKIKKKELFYLRYDLAEENNLSGKYPELTEKMT